MAKKSEQEIKKILRDKLLVEKGCEGKKKYLDQETALNKSFWDKDKILGKAKRIKNGHRPYQCLYCGFWHIGTQTNPYFRDDYEERIKHAQKIYEKIPTFSREPIHHLTDAFKNGMLEKKLLSHGYYYLGYCLASRVARWHQGRGLFLYRLYGQVKGDYVEGEAHHPEDDQGQEIFVPLEKAEPTVNQRVFDSFGEKRNLRRE